MLRHAGATAVTIALSRAGALARISVVDNGRGIDPGKDKAGSGIAGLVERVELMGGRLSIESRAAGTAIVAEIPEPA